MRIDPATAVLCVIDVQERLLAAMPDGPRVVDRCRRLAAAARILDVPALVTEQYPRGLGATPAAVASLLPEPIEKMAFSCCGCVDFLAAFPASAHAAVLAGLETHICVAQTALDFLGRGLAVSVCVDAVTSRFAIDHDVALRRLEAAGVVLTTTEAVLFEWCRSAENPRFCEVRELVLERPTLESPGVTGRS